MNSVLKAALDFILVIIVHPETGEKRFTYDECKGNFPSMMNTFTSNFD